ncbi:MAG: malate synthase G [Acidobacteria bacterium]|nr:MAG: malate synthase G [Acidobacteriota bacterium]
MSSPSIPDSYARRAGLHVAPELDAFVEQELAPRAGFADRLDAFWEGFAGIVERFVSRNQELLEHRAELQAQIDAWHLDQPLEGRRRAFPKTDYVSFLREIGYLEPEVEPFEVDVRGVDPEIAEISGPQLVVPVSNARYALNAANARWVSLYDAVYGTDVIPEGEGTERGTSYNPRRGALVVEYVERFLDRVVPLAAGSSHADAITYDVVDANGTGGASEDGAPGARDRRLVCELRDGRRVELADPACFVGFASEEGGLRKVLLRHHGLHLELRFDLEDPVGAAHPAGLADVIVEAAVTTIQDCEDSVAAVDAEDKVGVYRNWLGLMSGELEESFTKGGQEMTRRLSPDREYTAPDGSTLTLPGRALMLVRNVGLLMTTDAVLTAAGEEIPDAILDAVMTAAAALVDLSGRGAEHGVRNSRAGSMYVVKPKLHGSAEVAFTVELFAAVEQLLGMAANTMKIGIMDEERRTTLNLQQCIRAARRRVIFINTGFLDRTGDEMRTSLEAGPMVRKAAMKGSTWLSAYEDHNVDVGLRTGLAKVGQIGKGMWAMPDEMAAMVEQKGGHPEAGANCAWVPSPTAAALHAMHYHFVDVAARQRALARRDPATLDSLLEIPVQAPGVELSAEEIQAELDNNAQGILGYVVRWVEHGVGCSKVPDIHGVGLMEDRATCRISSQHIANWLHHGVTTKGQVEDTFRRMAKVVDEQNGGDPAYRPMADDYGRSVAFQAALALAVEGAGQPSGYTEPILHAMRRRAKATG